MKRLASGDRAAILVVEIEEWEELASAVTVLAEVLLGRPPRETRRDGLVRVMERGVNEEGRR